MICPNCLANNRKNASVCKSCGCPLRQDTIPEENGTPAPKVFRSDSGLARSDAKAGREPARSPMVKSSRQSPSASVPQIKVNSIVADNIDCTDNSVENELSCDTITIPTQRSDMPVRRKGGSHASALAVSNSARRRRQRKTALTLSLWLVVLGGLIAGIVLGIRYIGTIFSPAPPQTTADQAAYDSASLNMETDQNGLQYIHCVFNGNDGDSVLITQLNKRLNFENGTAVLDIYLSDLISASAQISGSTLPVSLQAVYRKSDGQEHPLALPTVEFAVPQTEITLISSDSKAIEVFKDSYRLVFALPQGSNLYVNDVISNDKVESSGRVRLNVEVGIGESVEVRIRAQAPYHSATEIMFTLYRQELHTKLTLANSNPKTVESPTVTLSGTTSKGTVISCGGYKTDNYTFDDRTGVFRITVTLPGYGTHDIVLTATDTEGRTARLTQTVSYLPNEDKYTRQAWAYEEGVATNPGQYMNKSFLFKNVKIKEFILAQDTMFLINMGSEEAPQYIYVVYSGNMQLNTKTTYRIFGDVTGVYDGHTLVSARYIYTW